MTSEVERRDAAPSSVRLPGPVWAAGAGAVLANTADVFVLFLLLWLAGPQGWTGVQTAAMVLVLRTPTLVSGMLIGRAVDRWGVRRPMLVDLVGRAVLLLLLFAAAAGGAGLPLPAVLVLGGLAGALSPTTYVAVRTLIPQVVPRDRLERANALVAVGDQLPLLFGSALVAPALLGLGPAAALLVPVGMLLVAAGLTRALPATRVRSAVDDPVDGPVGGRRRWPARVVVLVGLSTAYYFVYGPFESASPAYVRDQLGGGEGAYSLLWVLFGVGALASLPLAPRLTRWRPGVVNAVGAMAWGLVMLPVALTDDLWPVAVLFLVGGLVWGPYTTIETSALQRWIPPERLGAAFGLQRSLLTTATPVGAALGALALESLSGNVILGLSAAGCTLAGLVALTNRDLRTAR